MFKNVFLAAGLLLSIFSHFTQGQAGFYHPSPPNGGDFNLFLPFVSTSPHLDATLTSVGEDIGYPTRYFACGYLTNSTGTALYDSRLDLLVAIQGYLEPDFYPSIVRVTPAFAATLPGQPNPFSYNLLLGKASASIEGIHGTTAYPWSSGPISRALTIVQYTCDGNLLHGIVRNDNNWILSNLRIVALDPERCLWGEASPESTLLTPGGNTGFQMDFPSLCISDKLFVVGQGADF